ADSKTTSYGYDQMSRLTSVTDALSRTTNYEYDNFNRPVKTVYPPAAAGAARLEERVEYDAAGNVKKRIDTALRETLYDYDGANRLVKVTDPAAQVTQYEYNARSQMTAVVDALNQRYTFGYDALGRVTQITRGGLSMSYVHDGVGNMTSRTDYNGATTAYTYDNLNRLTNVTYPDSAVAYAYDELSRLSSATNVNGTVSFTYDNRGRVAGMTGVEGQAISYGYDANNNRTQTSLGQTPHASYQYDALNRLTQLADGGGAATTYVYDAADRLTSRSTPNGVATSYGYDGLDRLASLQHTKGATTVAGYQYQYDAASRITQMTEAAGAHGYGYDAADRLTSATHPAQTSESYTYDAVGNRTASHLGASYTYQPFNKVVTVGPTSYSYDSNGNLTQKVDAAGVWQYAWDYENRLKQVTRPDGQTVLYRYDALGRRVRRGSGGGWTDYVYDGHDVVKDVNSDGSAVEYLNGPGVDDKLRQMGNAGTYYFVQDHLGSTRALTDGGGDVVENVSYDSFGNGASTLTRYGYTGREWDADAALYYYRSRFYDPQGGRFISEDPIGLRGGVNHYAYVRNNPIRFNDPSGEIDWDAVFSQVKNLPRPRHTDNYDWYGTFWSEFGKGVWRTCKDELRKMKEATYDRWVAGIKEILGSPDVQFALVSLGMPYGRPWAGVSIGPGAIGATEVGAAEAGSIRNVNPTRGTRNCVNCAVATDATLAGRPASALPGNVTPISELERIYNGQFRPMSSATEIEQTLINSGPGSRGIIFGARGPGQYGHVFNGVNQNGVVRFLDGQLGGQASFNGYGQLYYLATH
ncbi:MAG TPA: RHS repeat-associated core domain-containing protein, partial [Pyrinomonadaceae bacterium]|nr:RHS repeat-associated core domain-containing protein [Pyrinomonadaceae bacterium]